MKGKVGENYNVGTNKNLSNIDLVSPKKGKVITLIMINMHALKTKKDKKLNGNQKQSR